MKDAFTDRRLEEARRATLEHLRRKYGASLPDPYERFASIEAARARDRDAQLLSIETASAASPPLPLADEHSTSISSSSTNSARLADGATAAEAAAPAHSGSVAIARPAAAHLPNDPLLPIERPDGGDSALSIAVKGRGFANPEADRFLATMPEFSTPAIRYQLLVSGQRFIGRSFVRRGTQETQSASSSSFESSTSSSTSNPLSSNAIDAESSALKEELSTASASLDTRPLAAVLRARDEAAARDQRASEQQSTAAAAASPDVEVDEQLIRDLKRWARIDESVTGR